MNTLDTQLHQLLTSVDRPYDPFREDLYTVKELMAGYTPNNPGASLDAVIARYYNDQGGQVPKRLDEALAQRVHDNSIDRALIGFVENRDGAPRKMIGIMGGHSASRKDTNYGKVARVAQQLTALGYCIVSGGGPGVMEAANLGAYMAGYSRDDLQKSLEILGHVPNYGSDDKTRAAYIQSAMDVLRTFPDGRESLSIPTWAYSDEPISQFPSKIGKYFANSIREDGLLAIGVFGVIFAPGSAGTMQEVFQDATHNSYWTFHSRSPMVFLDSSFYRANPSIYDVLLARANKDGYSDLVSLKDDPDQIVKYVVAHPPQKEHKEALRTIGRSSAVYRLDI
jgi:predicted Rossmann-fold nucleotide-binding protein